MMEILKRKRKFVKSKSECTLGPSRTGNVLNLNNAIIVLKGKKKKKKAHLRNKGNLFAGKRLKTMIDYTVDRKPEFD